MCSFQVILGKERHALHCPCPPSQRLGHGQVLSSLGMNRVLSEGCIRVGGLGLAVQQEIPTFCATH